MVDLPPEEALRFRDICTSTGYVDYRSVRTSWLIRRMSYVPLIAPSTSIDRVKFLTGIADSFIYVVSKVCSRSSSAYPLHI